MNSPFKYGKIVTGKNFINRSKDIIRIQNNISAGINTILISPRRWGKSSLMKQIANLNKDKDTRYAFIDFFNIRTEEDFLEKYAKEVIKCSISKKEDLLQAGKDFFQKITPSFSFGTDPVNDFSVNFSWNEAQKTKDEIINLPELIAKKKGIRVVVCIDEFQGIAKLKDHISFEQELRSYWQHHENTVYCLYGSRKHMMLELFKQESRAFFRFGDLFLLEKISEKHWLDYIKSSFRNTGKSIGDDAIMTIIRITNNHPDYLQQLCHNVWNAMESEVTPQIIEEAMDLVVRSHALHYQDICDSLSNTQLNLMYAILEGKTKLTASETMQKYKLGTPRNVSKNKKILEEKDIVEIHRETIGFNDPIFEYWLMKK
jgi:AAA+ ATPase superfamily predicted ATPase